MKPKIRRRKEIIKIKTEINSIEKRKTVGEINENKNWFFEKIDSIDKPLARMDQEKRGNTKITSVRNERGAITTDLTAIKRRTGR